MEKSYGQLISEIFRSGMVDTDGSFNEFYLEMRNAGYPDGYIYQCWQVIELSEKEIREQYQSDYLAFLTYIFVCFMWLAGLLIGYYIIGYL